MTSTSDILRGMGKHQYLVVAVAIFISVPYREAADIGIRAAVGCRVYRHSDT